MPTRIKCDIGSTVNLGDFNNIKFDFGIEDDVPEGKTPNEHFDKLFKWTWSRLEAQVDAARKAARG